MIQACGRLWKTGEQAEIPSAWIHLDKDVDFLSRGYAEGKKNGDLKDPNQNAGQMPTSFGNVKGDI